VRVTGDDDDKDSDWFWGVVVPGLRREEAMELADYARERSFGWHGQAEPVDPDITLVLWLDRATAEILRGALNLDPDDPRYEVLRGDISDWLARTASDT
jgi:hypothetical protein